MVKQIVQDNNNYPVEKFCVLNAEGEIQDQQSFDLIGNDKLIDFYKWMVKIRLADKRAINLQRTGKMGTYPSVYGQEACQVGAGLAMQKDDWFIPTFRETGMMWCYGVPLDLTMMYWIGNETGSKMPEDVNCLPIAITVGGHLPHAMGVAWANKAQGKPGAALASFSDGATSEGDFHSALNFAGVLEVPAVFFCQNNSYAISTPLKYQTASKTFAQKAFAYGCKAILVDGNDVVATYLATQEALRIAREENTPVLVEAVTYRLGDHTTVDNSKLYREPAEVEQMNHQEPIIRVKRYLEANGLWNEAKEAEYLQAAETEVEQLINKALEAKKLDPRNMFTKLYETMPPVLKVQHDEFIEELKQTNSDRI